MPHPIVMPSFGMYTTEGTLAAWLRDPGVRVAEGEVVLEIETDKATYEVVAPAAGVLHHGVERGAALKEQEVLGYILAEGEAVPGAVAPGPAHPVEEARAAAAAAAAPSTSEAGYTKASPLAKRLASEHNVDIAAVRGSGPNGRIVQADILAEVERRRNAPAGGAAVRVARRVPLTGIRRAIAHRLRESLSTAVSLTLTREVDAETLVAARRKLTEKTGAPVPYDALFAKILATALREVPTLNATVEGDEILLLEDVNIAFAVAVENGLLTPVIRRADRAPLAEIARQVREMTAMARSGELRGDQLDGGTATISNLGAQQVDAFTPVLNPPQSCILGIGRIRRRPAVRDGNLVAAETCILSLTFDHRVEDGAPAAGLVESVNRLMNDAPWLERLVV